LTGINNIPIGLKDIENLVQKLFDQNSFATGQSTHWIADQYKKGNFYR